MSRRNKQLASDDRSVCVCTVITNQRDDILNSFFFFAGGHLEQFKLIHPARSIFQPGKEKVAHVQRRTVDRHIRFQANNLQWSDRKSKPHVPGHGRNIEHPYELHFARGRKIFIPEIYSYRPPATGSSKDNPSIHTSESLI
jgi:hypothetical protein